MWRKNCLHTYTLVGCKEKNIEVTCTDKRLTLFIFYLGNIQCPSRLKYAHVLLIMKCITTIKNDSVLGKMMPMWYFAVQGMCVFN